MVVHTINPGDVLVAIDGARGVSIICDKLIMHNIETSMILKRLPTIPENHEAVKQDLAQLTHCAFATTATTYITNIGLKYHLESLCESADMWEEKS